MCFTSSKQIVLCTGNLHIYFCVDILFLFFIILQSMKYIIPNMEYESSFPVSEAMDIDGFVIVLGATYTDL